MNNDDAIVLEGGCTCGEIRYRLSRSPMYVHCCHCSWCQRETGSAFALNAMIESENVSLVSGNPVAIKIPSNSGKGQKIVRCPGCQVAVWSHYAGAGDALSFIRVGTLDNPASCPPDVHIYTGSKQPWVLLPPGKLAFEAYYSRSKHLPAGVLERLQNLKPV